MQYHPFPCIIGGPECSLGIVCVRSRLLLVYEWLLLPLLFNLGLGVVLLLRVGLQLALIASVLLLWLSWV